MAQSYLKGRRTYSMVRRIVVVPKRDGTVRICVDSKVLNESVLYEVYPIP